MEPSKKHYRVSFFVPADSELQAGANVAILIRAGSEPDEVCEVTAPALSNETFERQSFTITKRAAKKK